MRLTRSKIAFFLGGFFLFKPEYMDRIPLADMFFNIGIVITFAVSLFHWLLKKKIRKEMMMVFAFYFTLLATTLLHNGNIWTLGISAIKILGICLMIDLSINKLKPLLDSWSFLFMILVLVNLLIVLSFPEGLYRHELDRLPCYLFGHKNACAVRTFSMMAFIILRSVIVYSKLSFWDWCLVALTGISLVLIGSATSLVSFVFFVMLLFFMRTRVFTNVINTWIMMLTSIIFTLLFVVFRVQAYFSFLIEDLMQKSLTLTGRTRIWDGALLAIIRSPWIGWGIENKETAMQKLYLTTPHNTWLDMLYRGGIILFVLFVTFLIISSINIERYRESHISKIIRYILYFFFIYFIADSAYGNSLDFLFTTLFMACNLETIIDQSELFHARRNTYNLHTYRRYLVE